ncbi:MAG: SOS response-associated peptidase family protein, partial [Caulobacter sp.]
MKTRAEAAAIVRAMRDRNNNQPPLSGVYPNYAAPIITRSQDGTRQMHDAIWGLPSSKKALFDAATKRADKLRAKGTEFDFDQLLKMEPDNGTTNVRNTTNAKGLPNAHWRPWLGPANRCLVPFTSFSEYDTIDGKKVPVWFAIDKRRPLLAFAGIWTSWTCV